MGFNFDDLPREAQRAYFAKLNAALAARGRGRNQRKRVTAEELKRADAKYQQELRQRRAADKWVEEKLRSAHGSEVHVLKAIKNEWGTPEDDEQRGRMIRMAQAVDGRAKDAGAEAPHLLSEGLGTAAQGWENFQHFVAKAGDLLKGLLPPGVHVEFSQFVKDGWAASAVMPLNLRPIEDVGDLLYEESRLEFRPLPDSSQSGGIVDIGIYLPKGFVDTLVKDSWLGFTQGRKSKLFELTTEAAAQQAAHMVERTLPRMIKGPLRKEATLWVAEKVREELRKYGPDNWLKLLTEEAKKKFGQPNEVHSHPSLFPNVPGAQEREPHWWLKEKYRDSPPWLKKALAKTPAWWKEFCTKNSRRLKEKFGEEWYNKLLDFQFELIQKEF